MGLEPGTKAFRVKRSTAEPKIRATKKTLEGGDNAPSPETDRLPSNGIPKTETQKKIPEGKCPRKVLKPLPSPGSLPFPGTEQAVPGRAPSHTPRSPSSMAAPFLSPGAPRAVWGRRGAVARPRGVRWRLGEPVHREA